MKPVHLNDSSTQLTNVFESFSAKSAKFSRNRSTGRNSSQFKSSYCVEMCSGSEEGSYLRLIDFRTS